MRVQGDWLSHPGPVALCAALAAAGHQALFVGGCVRNALLGVPVADLDLASDATPDQVIAIATAAGLRPVPTGIAHGTVTVIAHDLPLEVTTFRRDVESHGRHATVEFSTRIADDAARRDFTMNALYATAAGDVVDPLGGLPDLLARRVRFVGDPDSRIREDYLRTLRFFRFHACYGDPAQGLDPEALAAIARHLDGLDQLSRERIGAETRKLLSAPDPAPALAAMQATGVLSRLLPGADPRAIAPLVHLEAGLPPRWQRRLLALGGPEATQPLRLSRAEAKEQGTLRAALALPLPEAAWRHGATIAIDAALVMAASLGQPLPPDWQTQVARAATAEFPVTAADLLHALQGRALGQRLTELESRWIASGFTLTRSDLLSSSF